MPANRNLFHGRYGTDAGVPHARNLRHARRRAGTRGPVLNGVEGNLDSFSSTPSRRIRSIELTSAKISESSEIPDRNGLACALSSRRRSASLSEPGSPFQTIASSDPLIVLLMIVAYAALYPP